MRASTERPILEAALETTEVVADAIAHGDVLSEIPVIGTAFKICRAVDAVRDRAFAAKLALFARGLDRIPETARDELKDKVRNKDELQKVGETLFMVLERLTDLSKPQLLSQIFLAYVDEIISSSELRRLAQAIDASFSDDLHELLNQKDVSKKSSEPWMQYLAASGLTRVLGGQTLDDVGQIYYEVTTLGHKLRNAYYHGR